MKHYDSISDYLLATGFTFQNDTFTRGHICIDVEDLAGKDVAYFQTKYPQKTDVPPQLDYRSFDALFGWISNDLQDVPLPFTLAPPYNVEVAYNTPFLCIKADHDDPDVTIHCALYKTNDPLPIQSLVMRPNNFQVAGIAPVGYFQPPITGAYTIRYFARKLTVESIRHYVVYSI